jgi:hypothetical protein
MRWHFGHNCKHFLPTLGKCRILIENYRKQEDLVEQAWLSTEDLLVYLNTSVDDVLEGVSAGRIKVKRQKNGKLLFGVLLAAKYDTCFHKDSGGQCLYFAAHNGDAISCIADLRRLKPEHPNMRLLPTALDVSSLENAISVPESPCDTETELF